MARTPHRWRWPDLFIETYMYDHRDHRMRLIYSLISFAEGIVMIADEVFMRYIPAFCISHGLCFFRGVFGSVFGFRFSVFDFFQIARRVGITLCLWHFLCCNPGQSLGQKREIAPNRSAR